MGGGLLQNGRWDRCLSLATWPAMGERERGVLNGVGEIEWRL